VLTGVTVSNVLLIVDKSGVRRASLLTRGIGSNKTTLRDLCIASRVDALFAGSPCGPGFI
jgi:hypothetical protein